MTTDMGMTTEMSGKTTSRFTAAEIAVTYDCKDSFYQSFWDAEGSLHWAYFDDLENATPADFLTACRRWDNYMLSQSKITAQSHVLDLGCGNGYTAIRLAQQTGCAVTGIDVSGVRIENAKAKAKEHPDLNLEFRQTAIQDMPLPDAQFSHVWSQATLYHVQSNLQAWQTIARVLTPGGRLIFDDLVAPELQSGQSKHQEVYDYYFFEPTFTQDEYPKYLEQFGFTLLKSVDLNQHLQKSYELLKQLVIKQKPDFEQVYQNIYDAIADRALGWNFYLLQKNQ